MAFSSLPNYRFAFAPIFFLLFLSSFIFFTKRNADVSLSLYKDLSSQPPFTVSLASPPPPIFEPQNSFPDSGSDSSDIESTTNPSAQETEVSNDQIKDKLSVNAENGSVSDGAAGASMVADDGLDLSMEALKQCDLYMGTWVQDEEHYPVYRLGSCPYVDEAYDCGNNGRADSEYTKWRWKPYGCDLPRYMLLWLMDGMGGTVALVGYFCQFF